MRVCMPSCIVSIRPFALCVCAVRGACLCLCFRQKPFWSSGVVSRCMLMCEKSTATIPAKICTQVMCHATTEAQIPSRHPKKRAFLSSCLEHKDEGVQHCCILWHVCAVVVFYRFVLLSMQLRTWVDVRMHAHVAVRERCGV